MERRCSTCHLYAATVERPTVGMCTWQFPPDSDPPDWVNEASSTRYSYQGKRCLAYEPAEITGSVG